jgi:hypothetical protein
MIVIIAAIEAWLRRKHAKRSATASSHTDA